VSEYQFIDFIIYHISFNEINKYFRTVFISGPYHLHQKTFLCFFRLKFYWWEVGKDALNF